MSTRHPRTLLYDILLAIRPAFVAGWLKRVIAIQRRALFTEQGYFWIDPVTTFGRELLATGTYEPFMVSTLNQLLRPKMKFVDLGANEGFFSVLASQRVGNEGKVLAVEPQKRLEPILKKNFKLNAAHNIVLEQCAVTDKNSTAPLYLTLDANTGAASLARTTRYNLPSQSVETVTLETLMDRNGFELIDLIKMDIEGFEYEAILGSPELFRKQRVRAMALEIHSAEMSGRGLVAMDIVRFLEDCGYTRDKQFTNWVYQSRAPSYA